VSEQKGELAVATFMAATAGVHARVRPRLNFKGVEEPAFETKATLAQGSSSKDDDIVGGSAKGAKLGADAAVRRVRRPARESGPVRPH
jgi:hypothetical protein